MVVSVHSVFHPRLEHILPAGHAEKQEEKRRIQDAIPAESEKYAVID